MIVEDRCADLILIFVTESQLSKKQRGNMLKTESRTRKSNLVTSVNIDETENIEGKCVYRRTEVKFQRCCKWKVK